jgi:hypothetical protein
LYKESLSEVARAKCRRYEREVGEQGADTMNSSVPTFISFSLSQQRNGHDSVAASLSLSPTSRWFSLLSFSLGDHSPGSDLPMHRFRRQFPRLPTNVSQKIFVTKSNPHHHCTPLIYGLAAGRWNTVSAS